MRFFLATLALSIASIPCSFGAAPQSLSILVSEGDSIAGVGLVTRIDGVEVSSNSGALVEVDTDNSDTDADSVLLRGSTVELREGQALTVPGGATLGSFDGVSFDETGVPALNLFLDGTSSSNNNSGLFYGDTLILQEGDVSTAPEFASGTVYTGFFDVQFGAGRTFLVMASVDDPTIARTTDRAIVAVTIDPFGGLLSERVIVKEGDVLPGQTEAVADFETGAEEYAINAPGQVMFTADLEGDTSVDRAIYLDSTLLLQEGSPSPVPGRSWGSLTSVELDVSASGSWVCKANLDSTDTSTDQVIVRDGSIFMREGDTLPDIAPFTFDQWGYPPAIVFFATLHRSRAREGGSV
ncbi:MAG: hypothetical protein AAGG01_00885 [Planctomycetota bacterium]